MKTAPIIFFDGVCGLCNGFVDLVIKADHGHRYRFSPLQGETAKTHLPPAERQALDSIAFYESGRVWRKSEAVLKILQGLGGVWGCTAGLGVLPLSLRDGIYDWISRNRNRLFGRRDSCRLPSPEEQEWFLD